MDEEDLAWDIVRDRINIDVEAGEFTALEKECDELREFSKVENDDGVVSILDLDDQQPGPSTQKIQKKVGGGRRSTAHQATLDNLVGQANLEHARGRTKEAMTFLFEAIKLSPYHMQTYRELSDLYAEQGQMEKSFEFKMLVALLNSKTTAGEWDEVAEMAKSFDRLELAVACLAKAIRCDPGNWIYYEKRIQLLDSSGDVELAMKTRLQAAQSINCQISQINFAWIDKLIKTAADYYCTLKDEERATEAFETFILRSREFGRSIDFEHLALLGMWMGKGRFGDSAKSILAMHNDLIQAVYEDRSNAMTFRLNFQTPGMKSHRFRLRRSLGNERVATHNVYSYLIICWIHLSRPDLITELVDYLVQRPICSPDEENAFLDIARSLHSTQQLQMAIDYMDKLKAVKHEFTESADAWFLYGCLYQAYGQIEIARTSYEKAISLQPGHIDARINLSTILQQMDQSELALETLKDLDYCSHIPDERLLICQAEVLLQQKKMEHYMSCLRMLLIPHYQIHAMEYANSSLPTSRKNSSMHQMPSKRVAWKEWSNALVQRRLESLNSSELYDYAFKLTEALYLAGEYEDMLHVVCYAFLHPKIIHLSSSTFNNLLFFASLKANYHQLAFEFVRFHLTYTLPKIAKENEVVNDQQQQETLRRVYLAMNYIFCQHQSVNYHRFIMRQLVKTAGV